MRSYKQLQTAGIIQNKRGIGYFVSAGASEKIHVMQKKEFIEKELPALVRKMRLLDIAPKELMAIIEKNYSNPTKKL